ncbi:hypothetical protein H4F36_23510 [Escherichia coli]|nr:hypothetical protein [Escherichia coli]
MDSSKAIQNAKLTLTTNTTLSISGIANGMTGVLKLTQDGSGGRTITLPASSKVVNGGAGAITLTTAAGGIDVITFTHDGSDYLWTYGKNFN